MTLGGLSLLESGEIEHLHNLTLALLEDMGVIFDDKAVLDAFDAAGAEVDHAGLIVRFPPDLLMKLVNQAPSRYTLGARGSTFDCIMGGEKLLTRPVVGCMYITDGEDKHRLATANDAAVLARLVDDLEEYTWNGAAIYPDDIAPAVRDVAYCEILFENTKKHFTISAYTPASLRYMIELGIVVAGSSQNLKERPLFNIVLATTSPMKYAPHQIGWIVEAGKAGIPAGIASTPLMGANGPITLAGCAIQIHAENLAGVALSQVMNPGAPVYYCSRPTLLDMRNGNSLWGPIEMGMIDAINVQLARYCGLPCDVLSLRTDAKAMDEQAAYERISNSLLPALAGVNSMAGGGFLEFVNAVSHEQVVIDAELMTMIRRVTAGIKIDDDHLAINLIKSVGHQGQFLGEEHTRSYHRTEFSKSYLADRNSYSGWRNAGGKDIVKRASEKANQVLAGHIPEPLSADVIKEMKIILNTAVKDLEI